MDVVRRGAAALLAAAWVWLVILTLAAAMGRSVSRPSFEAAGLALGAGVFLLAMTHRPRLTLHCVSPGGAVFAAAAASAAYAWSITLGPLSDDYQLFDWASRGDWTPGQWTFIRPLPLAIWQAVGTMGGWTAIHGLNVACHAANAALVATVAGGWLGARPGLAAGLVFALFPASTEAVAWAAGVFDLLATTTTLLAVVVLQRQPPSMARTAVIAAACVGGLLSKESALALPMLIALVAAGSAIDASAWRRAWQAPAAAIAVAIGFVAVRALASSSVSDHLASIPASRRAWKDLLVEPMAGAVLPTRADGSMGVTEVLLAASVLCLLGLLVFAVVNAHRRKVALDSAVTAFALGFVWVLIAALPLLATFHVSPTLEGSRYLYLSSAGFALAVGSALAVSSGLGRWLATAAVVVLLAVYGWRLQNERAIWQSAAATRDRVITAAQQLVADTGCRSLSIMEPPDAVAGAYVFRNGIEVALAELTFAPDGTACAARWDAASQQLITVPAAP